MAFSNPHASTPSSMRVRIAKREDAENITIVINSAFRRAEQSFISGDRIHVEGVLNYLTVGSFLVAESGGVLLGCVYVEPRPGHDEHPADRAYLGLLAVDPSRQQSGLGSVLMDAAEDYCSGLGCGFMDILVVNLRDELLGFYHKRGYVVTGTSPFPPHLQTKQPVHFIDMAKPLRPQREDKR